MPEGSPPPAVLLISVSPDTETRIIYLGSYFNDWAAEMGLPRSNDGEARFSAYAEGLTSMVGHADGAICLRLLLGFDDALRERRSVEPIAAITAPERTAAQHQSLLHFIGEGRWSDEMVLMKVLELVLPELERHGPIEAWIIDDTSFRSG